MIVVDTSALMALLLAEPSADAIAAALASEERVVICAGTLAEALIVAERRDLSEELEMLLRGIDVEVEPLTASSARAAAQAYAAWGKGAHAAGLNFGDCFAYACAKSHDVPLLFVGNDFAQTDIGSALAG